MRPAVSSFAGNATMHGQCGMGWHGSDCDVAHLTLGAPASAASCFELSYALVFVDIRDAYGSAIACLVRPMSDPAEWIRRRVG